MAPPCVRVHAIQSESTATYRMRWGRLLKAFLDERTLERYEFIPSHESYIVRFSGLIWSDCSALVRDSPTVLADLQILTHNGNLS